MNSRHCNAKTVRQDPMCLKHSQGNAIDINGRHIRLTPATIQKNPEVEDPFVLFPENIDTPSQLNTSVIGNALPKKPPPEVSPSEQILNATTRLGGNVVCPQNLKDFVEY